LIKPIFKKTSSETAVVPFYAPSNTNKDTMSIPHKKDFPIPQYLTALRFSQTKKTEEKDRGRFYAYFF